LDEDINKIMDLLATIDREIEESQIRVKALRNDIAEVTALCDKYKS
jgi:hypothetical protein